MPETETVEVEYKFTCLNCKRQTVEAAVYKASTIKLCNYLQPKAAICRECSLSLLREGLETGLEIKLWKCWENL